MLNKWLLWAECWTTGKVLEWVSGTHTEGTHVNKVEAALTGGSGAGVIFHRSAGSNKGWRYNQCVSEEMETENLSGSAVQLEVVKRKQIPSQLVENTDPSPNNKNTLGRMKLDPTSSNNDTISGQKPTPIQILCLSFTTSLA